ncbi:MAG: polyprenyl synthetase family protein [Hyphomicrobiaceae bacterium]
MTGQADFESRLADCARRLENRLTEQLDARTGLSADRLLAAMRHAVLGGGKRFRPFLLMEAAALFGVAPDTTLEAATAVEYIHAYSLVHDDLPCMDDDDLRRGKPTVHIAFDEATAVLAGDALQTMAFEVLSSERAHSDPSIRAELVSILATAAGLLGMGGGQMLDLEAETAPDGSADIARIQSMKTGALISAAVAMGAAIGGATAKERESLAAYAENLGLAFQISDDLLDVTGDAETIGKATSKDASAGKATFISLLGIDGAREKLAGTEVAALSALDGFGPRAGQLRDAMRFMSERQS